MDRYTVQRFYVFPAYAGMSLSDRRVGQAAFGFSPPTRG